MSSPIRLSIVTETFTPDVNGVARSLQQLLSSLPPQQFDLQIIRTGSAARQDAEWPERVCPSVRLPMYPEVRLGLPARRRVRLAWQDFKPDVVFVVTEGLLGYSAVRLANRLNIPVFSAFHTNFHSYSGYYGLPWIRSLVVAWLRRFHQQTRLTLVPSVETEQALMALGFSQVETLSHGVDCELFHPRKRQPLLRQQWLTNDEMPVLLYVGRIAAEKNIPLLLAAYRRWQQRGGQAKLVLVGDGPLRHSLERQNPDVIFTGVQTGEALAQHYASADAFVFPSLTETFGLVTLEAMASGLPVLAFDCAAAHQGVRDGCSGVLMPVDSMCPEKAVVMGLHRLTQLDRTQAGDLARQYAETVSWPRMADAFCQIVQAVLQDNPSMSTTKASLV